MDLWAWGCADGGAGAEDSARPVEALRGRELAALAAGGGHAAAVTADGEFHCARSLAHQPSSPSPHPTPLPKIKFQATYFAGA
jgi:hypothetical protein